MERLQCYSDLRLPSWILVEQSRR